MGAILEAIDDAILEVLGLDEDFATIPPFGPDGVATLVLDIEKGLIVTHRWSTDVQPMGSGKERRIALLDAPQQSFRGAAFLAGNLPRQVRSTLARYAAAGEKFLLGLPHEAMTLVLDAVGPTVYVTAAALALCDYKNEGQRVAIVARDPATNNLVFSTAIVQSATSSSITLNIAPGAMGAAGGVIMPLFPIYPEPQQDIERYRANVEKWKVAARAAIFDFTPTLARLALDTLTVSAAFNGVVIYARDFGALGNARSFGMRATGSGAGSITEGAGIVWFNYQAGVTTLAQMAAALAASSYVIIGGTYNAADTITSGDAFGQTMLGGGASSGPIGTGAVVATYNGDGVVRPVWDRELKNPSTLTDAVHAATRIIDKGATPYALSMADRPRSGRAIMYVGEDQADWQWWKKFTATVKGQQKAFWLPTWAEDLSFASKAPNTITVQSTDGSDFFAWWPQKRQYIQIVEDNGTKTYAKITAAIDNGNGTITLTIGTTLATSSVKQISWLELCRFSSDEFVVDFGGGSGFFAFESHATDVQQ